MKTTKIDIKTLTSEIKSLSRNKSAANSASMQNDQESSSQDTQNHTLEQSSDGNTESEKSGRFLGLIKEINSKDHYKIDRFIYVDGDIHEVFNKLKTHTKLKLSYLASHLLEEFILEHQESIKEIISKKQNKFLDA